MARTSCPRFTSDSATAVPNRPRPMTTTETFPAFLLLANNGALLGQAVVVVAPLVGECRADGDGADAADVHEDHQCDLGYGWEIGGDAGGQPDGRECGDGFEQHYV